MSTARPPLTDADRERIRELHAQGKGCNAIARDLERSAGTVSRAAKGMGLSWTSDRAAVATQVKQASNREKRADAIGRLYDRASRVLDRLEAPQFKVVGFDKNGRARVTSVEREAIPGTEERALGGMAVNYLVTASRLEAVDAASTDNSEARGILGALGDAMQQAYGQLAHAGTTPTSQLEDESVSE